MQKSDWSILNSRICSVSNSVLVHLTVENRCEISQKIESDITLKSYFISYILISIVLYLISVVII